MTEDTLNENLRCLLAKKQEILSDLQRAASVVEIKKAELSKIQAEILTTDMDGRIELADVMRW